MYVADGHCDLLYKLMNGQQSVINKTILTKANVKIQNFAIFVDPDGSLSDVLRKINRQIELYCKEIVNSPDIVWVKSSNDLGTSASLYSILSLEGCDAIGHQEDLFDSLWERGVRIFGITWNRDNAFATSCHTDKKIGLTKKGKQLIEKLICHQAIMDVSHLSERAFWDLCDFQDSSRKTMSLIASHSNCRSLCDHPRNLSDDQIRALAANKGMIGINFVPEFLQSNGQAELDDVLRHVEHVLTLVGDRYVAIGSDYDGARMAIGCEKPLETFPKLANAFVKRYNRDTAEKIMYRNWYNFFKQHLPIRSCSRHSMKTRLKKGRRQ